MRIYPQHIHIYFIHTIVKPSFLLQAPRSIQVKLFFERGLVALVVVRLTGESFNMLKTAFQNAAQLVGARDTLRLSSGAATAEMNTSSY